MWVRVPLSAPNKKEIDTLKLICILDQDEDGSFSGRVYGLNGICIFAGERHEYPSVVALEAANAHIEMSKEMNFKVFVDNNVGIIQNGQHVFSITV
ncbi:hypothetical protein CL89_gp302 [Aeromonas phage PX29]|uniref:Uncharacterized protein n=1 Tax=Aeromonas phage PX29 TaxID=926067 RepID=E5DQA9_9CAUD|nr:hypothetical protein CL89_gp302 [Aeromonas phage PX29]ADQ52895.1 conserved hypothetical protein [Aeromonas phage PX29]